MAFVKKIQVSLHEIQNDSLTALVSVSISLHLSCDYFASSYLSLTVLRLPALEIACDVRACLRDQGIGRGSLTGPLMHYVSTGRIKAQVWASWESE